MCMFQLRGRRDGEEHQPADGLFYKWHAAQGYEGKQVITLRYSVKLLFYRKVPPLSLSSCIPLISACCVLILTWMLLGVNLQHPFWLLSDTSQRIQQSKSVLQHTRDPLNAFHKLFFLLPGPTQSCSSGQQVAGRFAPSYRHHAGRQEAQVVLLESNIGNIIRPNAHWEQDVEKEAAVNLASFAVSNKFVRRACVDLDAQRSQKLFHSLPENGGAVLIKWNEHVPNMSLESSSPKNVLDKSRRELSRSASR